MASNTEGDINISRYRTNWCNDHLSDISKTLLSKDESVFIHQSLSTPCLNVLEDCDGIFLKDVEGRTYMDFHGNNVHQIGYKNKYVIDKIKEQLDELPFSPRRYTNRKSIECAQKLIDISPPNLNRVLFAPSGAVAISTALKLARIATNKHKIIVNWDSFHGATMDTISVGGESLFRKDLGPLMSGVFHVPPATSYRGIFTKENDDDLAYANYIEYVVEKEQDIGAILIETVRNTDVQIPSKAYWKKLRKICDKHDILLILDEIPICLGRTGHFFACEHFDIQPDILVIGKGLGGGVFPMAAMLTNEKLNIAQTTSLGHYTHEKSPIGAAAALATIEYIEGENLLYQVNEMSLYMHQQLHDLKNEFDLIGDVRGIGLLWAIELVEDRNTKSKASTQAERVMYKCLEMGLSFKVSQSNVLTLSPPLIINKAQLLTAVQIIRNAIKSI